MHKSYRPAYSVCTFKRAYYLVYYADSCYGRRVLQKMDGIISILHTKSDLLSKHSTALCVIYI